MAKLFGMKFNASKTFGGALGKFGGPVGALAGNWAIGQLTGKTPGEMLAPKNPMQGQLNSYMDTLKGMVPQRSANYLGAAQAGADSAYDRGRANLTLDLQRRGLGGGVLAGGLANLENNRAATMANAHRMANLDQFDMYRNLLNMTQQQGSQQMQQQQQGQMDLNQLLQYLAYLKAQKQAQTPGINPNGTVGGWYPGVG